MALGLGLLLACGCSLQKWQAPIASFNSAISNIVDYVNDTLDKTDDAYRVYTYTRTAPKGSRYAVETVDEGYVVSQKDHLYEERTLGIVADESRAPRLQINHAIDTTTREKLAGALARLTQFSELLKKLSGGPESDEELSKQFKAIEDNLKSAGDALSQLGVVKVDKATTDAFKKIGDQMSGAATIAHMITDAIAKGMRAEAIQKGIKGWKRPDGTEVPGGIQIVEKMVDPLADILKILDEQRLTKLMETRNMLAELLLRNSASACTTSDYASERLIMDQIRGLNASIMTLKRDGEAKRISLIKSLREACASLRKAAGMPAAGPA